MKKGERIVMKFGGSSLGSAERIETACSIIKSKLDKNPVVVVSAMGGVTDMLIDGAEKACSEDGYEKHYEEIENVHLDIIKKLGLRENLVGEELDELKNALKGVYLLKELSPRSLDYISSFGELMSSKIVAECLIKQGVKAERVAGWDAGIITDSAFGEATPILGECEKMMSNSLSREIVPIITGFIAKDAKGNVTTLGRGGSDYTASLIGFCLKAREIEIWTDVSGIMTADPRIVPDARTLRKVTYEEAAELAFFGAKVLHPRTIKPAMDSGIAVRILNTFKPSDHGTIIVPNGEGIVKEGETVRAIALKKGVRLVTVSTDKLIKAPGFVANIFNTVEEKNIHTDLISTSQTAVTFTLDKNENGRIDELVESLKEVGEVRVEKDLAIICIVGAGMKCVPGIAAKVMKSIANQGINLVVISQGASELNISLIVKEEDTEKAVRALHSEFRLGEQKDG